MTIGQQIKIARRKAGLTQKELAEKAGTATGTIQQYEMGKRQPRLEQLTEIARVLNLPVQSFLESNNEEPPQLQEKTLETVVKDLLEVIYGVHTVREVKDDSGNVIDSFDVYGAKSNAWAVSYDAQHIFESTIYGTVTGLMSAIQSMPDSLEDEIRRDYDREQVEQNVMKTAETEE